MFSKYLLYVHNHEYPKYLQIFRSSSIDVVMLNDTDNVCVMDGTESFFFFFGVFYPFL